MLEQDIFHFSQIGSIILAGDFNARVGQMKDYILHDKRVGDLDSSDYCSDEPLKRASLDYTCNTRGRLLLDLCKSTSLSIANGRLGADKNTGAFTYYSKHVCSTIVKKV